MTHDELLTEINYEIQHVEVLGTPTDMGLYNGIRAVVELHKPYINYRGDEVFCNYCESEGMTANYPCKSIRVIEKEML